MEAPDHSRLKPIMARTKRKIAEKELDPAVLTLVRALAIAYARSDHAAEVAAQKAATPEPPP